MDKVRVVTDSYIEALKGKKVIEAIFTTYTLDIDFFETEVLWILTGEDMNKFSPNNDVRRRELAHYYQKNKLPITLFFDRKVNNWDSDEQEQAISPFIEYMLVPVNSGNHAFHPKVTLLLLEDIATAEKNLLYVNGSNNLTYPGWWENVECVNIELLHENKVSSQTLLEECKKTIEYLSDKRKEIDTEEAFTSFSELLKSEYTHYHSESKYFSSYQNEDNFATFIKKNITLKDYDVLEIISPYFAENEDTVLQLLSVIKNDGCTIKLFLPKNENNELLCSELLFNKINEENNIVWASFQKNLQDELQMKTIIKTDDEEHSNIRTVHAKIFHWHDSDSKKSIYFIGSVNLSYKAFNDNEEAGKLVFSDNGQELLVETSEKNPMYAEDIDPSDEIPDNTVKKNDIFVNLSLIYDWKIKKLRSSCISNKISINDFTIHIGNKEIKLQDIIDFTNEQELEVALQSSSFVTVKYEDLMQKVFVNQKSFTHKPLDLGNLTVKEILEIYAKFGSFLKDNDLIQKAIQRALQAKGIVSDIDLIDNEMSHKNFFSEYSEIFYGLRHLKVLLLEEPTKQEYFLDENTRAMDSIPVLIEESFKDEKMDLVSKYITFLYIKQIYEELDKEVEFIDKFIVKLKEEYNKEFQENEEFIEWFEFAFFMKFSKGASK